MNDDERDELAAIYAKVRRARDSLVDAHDLLFAAAADLNALVEDNLDGDDGDRDEEGHRVTVTCRNCNEEYPPSDARWITIRGPGDVHLGCPNCGYGNRGPHPTEIKDEDEDVDGDEDE